MAKMVQLLLYREIQIKLYAIETWTYNRYDVHRLISDLRTFKGLLKLKLNSAVFNLEHFKCHG